MKRLDHYWYGNHPLTLVLAPLSWLYCGLAVARRAAYRAGILKVQRLPVPVIVVGNLTAGGTGKTPLVAWLAEFLKQSGYSPGIVSRGYRGRAQHWPQQVRPDSDPVAVGDEAVVLARHCACPIAVGPDRVAAVRALLEHHACDVIVSDDGLQHYALGRDVEIAVIDGVRRFGNGRCLPAGPLREPASRLRAVDLVVVNGLAGHGEYAMRLSGEQAHNLKDEQRTRHLKEFAGQQVHAVAGIGHPARFVDLLRRFGVRAIEHAFPDHHLFEPEDFSFDDGLPVLMTEKDAVKCQRFAADNYWYVPVAARPDARVAERLLAMLEPLRVAAP